MCKAVSRHKAVKIAAAAVLTLTRIIKSVVTGQAPVTGVEECPRKKKHKQDQKWYTCIS